MIFGLVILNLSDYAKVDHHPHSCDDVKEAGNFVSGEYTISPSGGEDSFTVYCDMSTAPPTHILHHSEEAVDTLVDGFETPGDYKKPIVYTNDVSLEQAHSLVIHSESCSYSYEEKCSASLMTGYTFWEAYDGQHIHDLAGATDTICRGKESHQKSN